MSNFTKVIKTTILLILISCQLGFKPTMGESNSTTDLNNEVIKDEVYKIGIMLPYGIYSDHFVNGLLDGILTAGVEINESENYSFSIEFVIESEGNEFNEQMYHYESLKSKGVQLIIGPTTSRGVYNLAPQSSKDKIPLLSPSATSINLNIPYPINNSYDYFFRVISSDLYRVRALGSLIYSLNHKNLFVVYDKAPWAGNSTEMLINRHIQEFTELGGTVEGFSNYEFQPDIQKIVNEIIKSQATAITVIDANPQNILSIYNGIKQNGLAIPLFTGDIIDSLLNYNQQSNSNISLNEIYGVTPSKGSVDDPYYNRFISKLIYCNNIGFCTQGIEPVAYEDYCYDFLNQLYLYFQSLQKLKLKVKNP